MEVLKAVARKHRVRIIVEKPAEELEFLIL